MEDGLIMSKKAVIMLVGGVPGVGKTSISGYIARKLGVDIVISGDYLREFVRPLLSGDQKELIECSVYDAWKFYGEKNRDNIVKGYLEQTKILWPGMEKILERAMENGESLIIETLYFPPSMFQDLSRRGLYSAYLYIANADLHDSRLRERQEFTHFNSPGERLANHLEEYRIIMEYTVEEVKRMGATILYNNSNYLETRDTMLKNAEVFFDTGDS